MAAGIAYWALFSLFPLALAAISILGFIYTAPEQQAALTEGIVKVVPVSVGYLASLVEEVVKARGTLGVLAILVLLSTGTAVFSAVRRGINHAWQVQQPHFFLVGGAIDLVMLITVALWAFLIVAYTTDAFGLTGATSAFANTLAVQLLLESLGLALTYGAFLLMYRYVPNTRVAWRDVWFGALVGAASFYLIRLSFGWFVGIVTSFNLVYGSLGALMAVLVWAYVSALALMFGAQVAATYSRVFGSRAGTLPELQRQETRGTKGVAPSGILTTMARWLVPPRRERP
jgi:membrane protein